MIEAESAPAPSEMPPPLMEGHLPGGERCGNCGALADHDDQFCPHCGNARGSAAAQAAGQIVNLQCGNCGTRLSAEPERRSFRCPFCDAAQVVEFGADVSGREAPEFIIGFAVTAEKAADQFRDWIRSAGMFRPGDLKSKAVLGERLQGVYIPFWSFSMFAESDWSAQVGEYWYRTETYTTTDANGKTVTRTRQVRETEWWPLSGRHHQYHSHYLVSGSSGLGQGEADAVKPFHLAALHRYQPTFLAGWPCEEYSVERDAAAQVSVQEFHRREQNDIAAFLPGDTYSGLNVSTQFSRGSSDLILLPMYIANYKYSGKPYRFLINGQTGRIAGNMPVSYWRIGFAVALVIAAIVAAFFAYQAGQG